MPNKSFKRATDRSDSISISFSDSDEESAPTRQALGRSPAPRPVPTAIPLQQRSAFDTLSRPKTSGMQSRTAPQSKAGGNRQTVDDDDASIPFDESMLGDSGEIEVGGGGSSSAMRAGGGRGLPPRPSSSQHGKVPSSRPGLPPKAPKHRVSGDSGFSLSGSLDFSGDLEVEVSGRPQRQQQQRTLSEVNIRAAAMVTRRSPSPLARDPEDSFEISGDLSMGSGDLDFGDATSAYDSIPHPAARPVAASQSPSYATPPRRTAPEPAAPARGGGKLSRVGGRLSGDSDSLDLGDVSFGSSVSSAPRGNRPSVNPPQPTTRAITLAKSIDSDDIQFSDDDDESDSHSSTQRPKRPASSLGLRPGSGLGRRSLSRTPSLSGEVLYTACFDCLNAHCKFSVAHVR